VDYREFVAACIAEQTLYNQDNLETVFHSLDADKSGGLSQVRLRGRGRGRASVDA
jgi:hypothetical protein